MSTLSPLASLHRREPSAVLRAFADDVGASGPVAVRGGGTQWAIGGLPGADVREVRAPAGIVAVEAEELIVRCGAGTTWAELDSALASVGMVTPLDPLHDEATVGGLFSVGRSGLRRGRYGHIRDLLLEATYVSSQGELVKAGAPVVKNVTGYDLCRLLVGSLGTLGLLGEVVMRCRPRAAVSEWVSSPSADCFAVRKQLVQPGAVLWGGSTTWVLIEGTAVEARVQRSALDRSFTACESPISRVRLLTHRASVLPSEITGLVAQQEPGSFFAEIGVGVVHSSQQLIEPTPLSDPVRRLNEDLKRAYDPAMRLNPGRCPW
jgi:glycolate oxidase FAD binding subunit